MGIALFTAAKLFAPLQALLQDCASAASRRWQRDAKRPAARSPLALPVCSLRAATQRPLRVLRVVDGTQGSRNFGRMVISGRMADVCAELDRLAAMEGLGS